MKSCRKSGIVLCSANKVEDMNTRNSTKEVIIDGGLYLNNLNICAQSESALDDHEDSSHWNVIPKVGFDDNDKDGQAAIEQVSNLIDRLILAGR